MIRIREDAKLCGTDDIDRELPKPAIVVAFLHGSLGPLLLSVLSVLDDGSNQVVTLTENVRAYLHRIPDLALDSVPAAIDDWLDVLDQDITWRLERQCSILHHLQSSFPFARSRSTPRRRFHLQVKSG